ncbi:MAG: hypothetical protein AAF998_03565 [Bacteroidota bacterium]
MKRSILLLPVLAVVLLAGCRQRPGMFVEQGILDFSVDTIFFDTLFTTFDSPTERVVVTNNTGENVRISEVRLERADEFDLIFDGIDADTIQDFELQDGDSAVAFVSFRSGVKDDFTRDRLLFRVGSETQDVDIEAYLFDAIFLQDTLLGGFGGPSVTGFAADKRYVIDGCLQVAEGHTLIIPAGTQIFFTPKKDENFNLISAIKVAGRLLVQGVPGNEPTFQQTRFGDRYEETPGQWLGILFARSAVSCEIRHALIKNGLIGVYQEFENTGVVPKVYLEGVEIRNMAGVGILSSSFLPNFTNYPQIRARNCLIHNCAEANLLIQGGGNCDFQHCTFANYTVDFSRRTSQVAVNNYLEVEENAFESYPAKVRFDNCIIWGSEEEEFVPDSFPVAGQYDVTLHNTIVRTTLELKGSNIITSQEFDFAKFEAPTEPEPDDRDYRLKGWSPAVNAGVPFPGIGTDKDGFARDGSPDLGCYEFRD